MSAATVLPNAISGVHPYANKFPMLPESELAELAESIRANGLRNPIVVTPDGLVLDGRNRLAACERAGVEPTVTVYDGSDLAEYVIDCNSSRRHMSTGARAMATAMVLAEDGRRGDGRWKRGSVDIGESSVTEGWLYSLKRAGHIIDHAPDLAAAVVNGHLALDAAYKQATDRRDAERLKLDEQERLAAEEADAKTFIEQTDPDLAAKVNGKDLRTYAEAKALWEQRNREEARRLAAEKAEKKKRAAEERQARTDLYTGIAKGLETCGGYGGYQDIPKLMAEYNPTELDPPQYARAFTIENLNNARRFADELIKWQEQQ